jgi:dipeptidyl-peptidase-4
MRTTLLLLALCLTGPVLAAGVEPLDAKYLRTHAATRGFTLGRPQRARLTPDSKAVLFLRSQPRVSKLSLYEFDVATGKTRELLTPEQVLKGAEEKLTPEEKARRERMRVGSGGFTDFQLSPAGRYILLGLSGRLYLVDRTKGDLRELKTGDGTLLDPHFAPNGGRVAYVRDNDVYTYDLTTDKEQRVTTGGTDKKTHGLAEFVAQEEMNRFSGFWWSPDSKFIVYEEADADGVETWYVADPAHPERPALPSFYPRPGKNNVKVRLGIIPVTGGETVWIDWDVKKFPYLGSVHWEKNGPLTLTVQSRDQKDLALLKVDPKTGKTTPLLIDHDPAWVELRQDVPLWLADDKGFLWVTERGGAAQLELRDLSGKLKEVLVGPEQGYRSLVSADSKTGSIAFLRSPKVNAEIDPTSVVLSVLNGDGKIRDLGHSRQQGMCSATFSKDRSLYLLTCTSPMAMSSTSVYKADGTKIGDLPTLAEEPGFVPKVEFVKVGEAPGFQAAIVRPRDFDPKKKYPVIVDVYGGPGHQTVVAAMRNWLLPQWVADQGFIVVSLDNRGTPGRGHEWERAIYQKFGSVPLEDQVAGLQALGKKYPELDLGRVGIVGWSFGGYMAALAVLKRPDVFIAAVAGAPVTDWYDYDTHYTERYLGVPKEKDDPAYRDASLLTYAKDLKRPLLLVHGTADDNVYFRHTLKLVDALFRAGRDFEVLPLAGLTHMVPDPVVMERLWTREVDFFHKHLGKPRNGSGQ